MHPFCKKVKRDLSIFDLNIHGLEEKNYVYTVDVSDSFFKEFDQDIIKGGDAVVEIKLEKSSNLLRLNFHINANVLLECARSLDIFTENYICEGKHIYKFGEKAESLSEDLSVLSFGTPKVNVADHVFDFLFLSIPMKILHPRFRNEDNTDEDGVLVYKDKSYESEEKEPEPDPRWAGLLKLKNKA